MSVVAAGAAVGIPAAARAELAERAAAKGMIAEVGEVSLGLGRIWLQDVVVEDPKLVGSRGRLASVEVRVGLRGVSAVVVHGGEVRLHGSADQLRERLESLRSPVSATLPQKGATGRRIAAEGLHLRWTDPNGRTAIAWGAGVALEAGDTISGRFDLARFASSRFEGELRGVELEAGHRRLSRFEAAHASARVRLSAPEDSPDAAGPPSTGPPPASALSSAVSPDSGLETLRGAVRKYSSSQLVARVVALSLEVTRGAEALRIGPSRVEAARNGESVRFEVTAHPKASAGTPLSLRAHLPLQGSGGEVELSGGPVSLAALGVREGDFGLVGVRDAQLAAEARLVFDANGRGVEVTSRGRLENARLRRPALAPDELSGIALGWRLAANAELDGSQLQVKRGEISLGEVQAEVSGEFSQSLERTHFAVDLALPVASCAALFDALPRGAAPLLNGVKLAGTFGLRAHVAYDSAKPSATAAKIDVRNECRITEVPPAIAPARFRKPWQREVQGVRGPIQIESGPGTADWAPYEDISPHMETAVLVCEDEGFFRHRGFAYRAIENSIQQNLIEGRFLRGASTVSMQLAKNLYLGREKTLSRKLQEAVLTQLLEQELSKHEIMELYLNVIEFGPGLYGIRQAARYYFNEEPRNLSLGQALYLGSILPSPDTHHFAPDGRVTEKWSNYLRKLMQIAYKIRRISEEELDQGLAEQVVFRQPNLPTEVLENVEEGGDAEPPIPELP